MSTCAGVDVSAVVFPFTGLKVGFSYAFEIEFKDQDGVIDITGDTFSMPVKNALGVVVATLTLGSGLQLGATAEILVIQIESPITDAAGTYTYVLSWTRPATSEEIPAMVGVIKVSA